MSLVEILLQGLLLGLLFLLLRELMRDLGDLYTESEQTSQVSFSAVPKPNFAKKNTRWKALAEICTVF